MTYEVSAAAKPPQTTPLYMGIRVDPREGNGEYRRRRASGRCAHLDRQNGTPCEASYGGERQSVPKYTSTVVSALSCARLVSVQQIPFCAKILPAGSVRAKGTTGMVQGARL